MTDALPYVVPLVSVLIGAAITYGFNVRQTKRSRVDEVFHRAVGAVAVAHVARVYIADMPPLPGASQEEHAAFMREIHREGHLTYVRAVADARSAVAEASAYDQELSRHLTTPDPFQDHADEITARLLRTGQRLRVKELGLSVAGYP